MKHTKEEIINALKVIKDECREQYGCNNCPFHGEEGECKIAADTPSMWDIAKAEPETWRVLK